METVAEALRYYRRISASGKTEPSFFELVRRVEAASGERSTGKSSARGREPIRFGQLPHLNCPASMVAEIIPRANPLVFVYFLGLWGPNGPLPLANTEYAYQRMHNYGDHALRRFVDIINHRFIGLYYRAWKANEQAVGFDKPDGGLITSVTSAFSGSPANRSGLHRFTDANWSGVFGCAVKSREGLETLLDGSFPEFRIRVRDRVEIKGYIPADSRARLGCRGSSSLGRDLQIGSTFVTRTRKFIIEVDGGKMAKAAAFLPGRKGFRKLVRLTVSYLDRPLEWDLVIKVDRDTIPESRLDGILALGRTINLGGGSRTDGRIVIGASRLAEAEHRRGRFL